MFKCLRCNVNSILSDIGTTLPYVEKKKNLFGEWGVSLLTAPHTYTDYNVYILINPVISIKMIHFYDKI